MSCRELIHAILATRHHTQTTNCPDTCGLYETQIYLLKRYSTLFFNLRVSTDVEVKKQTKKKNAHNLIKVQIIFLTKRSSKHKST